MVIQEYHGTCPKTLSWDMSKTPQCFFVSDNREKPICHIILSKNQIKN